MPMTFGQFSDHRSTEKGELDRICDECGAPIRDHMIGGPAPYHPRPIRSAPEPAPQVREALELVADAIDEARYRHPEYPRERPRPFADADRGDREYALRLARAAFAALTPVVAREPVGWRWRTNVGDGIWGAWRMVAPSEVEALRSGPWSFNFSNGTAELQPLFTSPPPASAVREATIEECAKVAADCLIQVYPHNSSGLLAHQIDLARADVVKAIRALSRIQHEEPGRETE